MVFDNSDCNSFAPDDDSEEDKCRVCGGSYSTDTDDRKPGLAVMVMGVTAGSTIVCGLQKKAQHKITLPMLACKSSPA